MQVKVCNLRANEFNKDFIDSLLTTGFAVVTHHGLDHGVIKEMQQCWRMFFLAEQEYKDSFVNEKNHNHGYKGFKTEKAVGAKKADLKEFFHWQPGSKVPFELSSITQAVFFQLEDIGGQMLKVIDDYTGNTAYRKYCENSSNTILRTLYYPALDFEQEKGAVRAAAHEDINFITLLVAASAPGLQVQDKEGRWHDVPHEENSIVVNIGDMLQLASNGLFKSTTHRVINPSSSRSDRVSMPLFIHPNPETILAPGFTAQQYLDQRLAEIIQKS